MFHARFCSGLTRYPAGRLSIELMSMCEQDPDILRWGLHHLLGDLPVSSYSGTDVQDNADNHDNQYVQDTNGVMDRAFIENDEVIAHALQEEFSNVAVAEASGPSHADQEQLQASVLAQNWFGPPISDLYSGTRM